MAGRMVGIRTRTVTPFRRVTSAPDRRTPGSARRAAGAASAPVSTARAPARAATPADQRLNPATTIWRATRKPRISTGREPISSIDTEPRSFSLESDLTDTNQKVACPG